MRPVIAKKRAYDGKEKRGKLKNDSHMKKIKDEKRADEKSDSPGPMLETEPPKTTAIEKAKAIKRISPAAPVSASS